MAEELVLKLKVETGDSKKLEDTSEQLNKIKTGSKEAGESVGVADTKIGKMWNGFKAGAQKGIQSMMTLKGAIAATGIGLLVLAVISLTKYFTGTARGAEQLKVIMAALGQVISAVTDTIIKIGETLVKITKIIGSVVKGNQTLKEGFAEAKDTIVESGKAIGDTYKNLGDNVQRAIKLAERENQLRRDQRDFMVEEAKLNVQIAEARNIVADATLTASERLAALNEQEAAQAELWETRKKIAKEQYEQIKERNSLSESTLDDLDAEAQALAHLIQLEADANAQLKEVVKRRSMLSEEQKRDREALAKKQQELVDAEIKRQQELLILENQIYLSKLEGREKDLESLRFAYEESVRVAGEDLDKRKLLEEKYNQDVLILNKKYDDEQVKAEEEKNKKIEDLQKTHEANLLAIQNETALLAVDKGREYDELRLEQQYNARVKSIEDSLLSEEQKQEELLALEELYQEQKAEIEDQYLQQRIDKELQAQQALNDALKQAALAVAAETANAVFSVKQNRLDKQKEAELANENLTEEQKAKIVKKYAEKQKKLDIQKAIVGGALAVISGLQTQPFIPMGIIAAALAAAATAIQIATIKKTQYALGGVVQGNSHALGGVDINVEGGEGIIKKQSMANPVIAQQFQQLNAGVPVTQEQRITPEDIIAGVTGAIRAIPVQLTENQVTEAQRNVVVREERFTVR